MLFLFVTVSAIERVASVLRYPVESSVRVSSIVTKFQLGLESVLHEKLYGTRLAVSMMK